MLPKLCFAAAGSRFPLVVSWSSKTEEWLSIPRGHILAHCLWLEGQCVSQGPLCLESPLKDFGKLHHDVCLKFLFKREYIPKRSFCQCLSGIWLQNHSQTEKYSQWFGCGLNISPCCFLPWNPRGGWADSGWKWVGSEAFPVGNHSFSFPTEWYGVLVTLEPVGGSRFLSDGRKCWPPLTLDKSPSLIAAVYNGFAPGGLFRPRCP